MQLLSQKNKTLSYGKILPEELSAIQIPGSKVFMASGGPGKIVYQLVHGEFLSICHKDYLMQSSDQYLMITARPLLTIHIAVKGSVLYKIPGLGDILLHERALNLVYLPSVQAELQLEGPRNYKTIDILMSRDYLEKYASASPAIEDFIRMVDKQSPVKLLQRNAYLLPSFLQRLDQLLYLPAQGTNHIDSFEAAAWSILMALLKGNTEALSFKKAIRRPQPEINQIYDIKEHIVSNLKQNLHINELVDLAGMSAYKLNKGFEDIYGMEVSDFIEEEKMRKAILLLRNKSLDISAIAYATGYEYPDSFRRAFKRRFGLTPMDYRLSNPAV